MVWVVESPLDQSITIVYTTPKVKVKTTFKYTR